MNTCEIITIFEMSKTCTNLDSIRNTSCIPKFDDDSLKHLRTIAGIWCILNGVVGFVGNLLTLLAIPYASRRKKFSMDRNWNSTTIFILNLATADWLYCAIHLPMYAQQYLTEDRLITENLCFYWTFFRYINAFADWMALGMIAVSRCLVLIYPNFSKRITSGINGKLIILSIWIYAAMILLPLHFDGTFGLGTFGYNCRQGKCDFIPTSADTRPDPQVLYFGIGFTVPGLLTVISYLCIWGYIRVQGAYLREATSENRRQLNNRDLKMTWTILMVCLCYFIFVMPISMINMIDPHADWPELHLFAFCLYWMQYSLNFLVYAAQSRPYRKAYGLFLYDMKEKIVGWFCGIFSVSTTTVSSHIFFFHRNLQDSQNDDLDIQMNNPRIGSPLASVVLDNYPSVSLANNIKSVEGTSILILTKTSKVRRWRKPSSNNISLVLKDPMTENRPSWLPEQTFKTLETNSTLAPETSFKEAVFVHNDRGCTEVKQACQVRQRGRHISA